MTYKYFLICSQQIQEDSLRTGNRTYGHQCVRPTLYLLHHSRLQSLLPIAYNFLTIVLCDKLKPHVKALIGNYQCGFRPGKFTIDQLFTLRQILKKRQENQEKMHQLFVDFKAAFDSPVRDGIYAAISELGTPAKR